MDLGCCGCVTVQESQYKVVERFGEFSRILGPGLHCYNCMTENVAHTKSLKVMTEDLNCETVTKESLSVTMKISVQYKIRTPTEKVPVIVTQDDHEFELDNLTVKTADSIESQKPLARQMRHDPSEAHHLAFANDNPMYLAVYACNNPIHQIKQLIEGYIRSVSRDYTLLEMFQSKNAISGGIYNMLAREITPFGLLIHRVVIGDIDPPANIKASMNRVLESQNQREAMINQAEAEKTAAILRAEGTFQVRKLEGEAIAAQRRAIVDGLRDITQQGGHEPDSHELTTTMVLMQYLDVLNAAAINGKNTFILPSSPANITNIEADLNAAMRANIINRPQLGPQGLPPHHLSFSNQGLPHGNQGLPQSNNQI